MQQLLWNLAILLGSVAFALSGAMAAIAHRLDLVGIVVLGTVTCVGGGIIRDCLLTRTPAALLSPVYVLIGALVSILAFLLICLAHRYHWRIHRRWSAVFNALDAVGLGVFSVSGVREAMTAGFGDNAFLCLFMGVLTGVGGGMIRDVLSMHVPAILCRRVYAVAALCGAALFYALTRIAVSPAISMTLSAALVFVIRMLATHYRWQLPQPPEDAQPLNF